MENKDIEQQLNQQNIIQFIWTKRKIITIVTFIAAVASLVISFFITPLYLSTAVVFPAATSTVSFSEQRNAKASSMDFGEEEQAEQLVQILQSSKIRDKIVQRFDLMKHYDIKETDQYKYHRLGEAYASHIKFTRTRFGSIQIDVLDKDPKLAATIANKIVDLIDTVKNEMVKERTIPAFEINKRKKDLILQDMKFILSKLDSLSSLGVVTSEGRATLFQAYNEAKGKDDKKFFKKQIDVNIKHGAEFDGLAMLRDEKMVKLAEFETAFEQAESDAYTDFNHKFVVENAVVADKKEKPKKAIIVLVSTIASFIFMVFALLIQARLKELRKEA
jgi:LPS O-antigen subunit length determinant protein (WzzB/FepE family)